jgi:transcriptional regulator with XRE-family HTH domain
LNAPGILDQLRREGLVDAQAFASTNAHPIGKRLRTLRLSQKKSLAEVALAVGVSVGFLSNLERSQTGASIGIIHRLAQYYDSNILDFFSRTAPSGPLVRARDRQTLHGWDGVRMDLLAWGDTIMEPHLFHIEPGCGSKEVYSHAGQEFLFLLSGSLIITLNEVSYKLVRGDSFYFESQIQHRWINPGKRVATVLWINSPPTF